MVNDETKVSILDWLFGKKALDKASKTGQPDYTSPSAQTTDYIQEQIKRSQQHAKTPPPVAPQTKPIPKKKDPISKKAMSLLEKEEQNDSYYS